MTKIGDRVVSPLGYILEIISVDEEFSNVKCIALPLKNNKFWTMNEVYKAKNGIGYKSKYWTIEREQNRWKLLNGQEAPNEI